MNRKAKNFLCSLLTYLAVVLIAFLASILCGCSSHKSVVRTSSLQTDTSSVVAIDTIAVHVAQTDSTTSSTTEDSGEKTRVEENLANSEQITEHIEERVDSAGNKTQVIDRTINRQGSYTSISEADAWSRKQNEYMSILQSRLDSSYYAMKEEERSYKQYIDSLQNETEGNTNAIMQAVKSVTAQFVAVVLILIISVSVLVYYSKKKTK